jgi:hypothetical protein
MFQLWLAYGIIVGSPTDSLYTVVVLSAFALLYIVWRKAVLVRAPNA